MSRQPDRETIRDEFESLTRMSKEAGSQRNGIVSRMRESQYLAMCLGAMQALAWVLGQAAPPTMEINNKVRELDEQQTTSAPETV